VNICARLRYAKEEPVSNAEFRRNVWCEFTPAKIIISPVIIGIITLLVYAAAPRPDDFFNALGIVSGVLMSFILLLWATKQASESVIGEVNDRTWVFQKMSSVRAIDMTIGKLFGSTVYAWYTAGFCLVAYVISALFASDGFLRLKYALLIILAGLVGHALSMMLSLIIVKNARFTGKTGKNSVFLAGVVIGCVILAIASSVFSKKIPDIQWMGITVHPIDFFIFSAVYAAFWSIAGLYRMMRQELQYDNTPTWWCVFVVTLLVYFNGLTYGLPNGEWGGSLLKGSVVLWTSFPILVLLTYLTLLTESFDTVMLRKLVDRIRRRRWRDAAVSTPLWMPTVAGVLSLTILMLGRDLINGATIYYPDLSHYGSFTLSVLPLVVVLFLLRDLGVIGLIKSTGSGKGDFYIAVYLVLAYGLMPTVLTLAKAKLALHCFWPVPIDGIVWQSVPPALECAAAGYLVWMRRGKILGI